jgi:protein-disulfide isomerase
MSKINPYIIIIVVLLLIVAGFVYDKWGGDILPGSVENPGGSSNVDTKVSKDDIIIGNEDAPVTIVEYFSYFCGYCKRHNDDTYPKILQDYISTGKVKYVFRIYPPFELAMAVLCANDQDKFFEVHNEIFEKSEEIMGVDDLKIVVGSVLDEEQFNQCYDSEKYLDKAEEWYAQGEKDFENAEMPEEQRGTPAFFINGELLIGAQPYDKFVEVIERKLAE